MSIKYRSVLITHWNILVQIFEEMNQDSLIVSNAGKGDKKHAFKQSKNLGWTIWDVNQRI